MTELDRLLDLFLEKRDVMVYEMNAPQPRGLGISQYGRAILQLRRKGHPIRNVKPGHFRYELQEIPSMTDTNSTYNYGYEKFKEAGQKLKANRPIIKPTKNEYEDLTTEELESRKQTAETWLEANREATNYADGLKRYEQICDELTFRQAEEELL